MKKLALAMFAALTLAACAGTDQTYRPSGPVSVGNYRDQWTIGPVVWGENKSVGMPLHPSACVEGIFCIDIPVSGAGHVHYVTFRHGSLAGAHSIIFRGEIEADPGVTIEPITAPGAPAMMTAYFQRAGDTWLAEGEFESYRWYASFATITPLVPGPFEIIAPFDSKWTAILYSSRDSAPSAFAAAIANADEVGFVLGGGNGYGHGIFATGRARIIVKEFKVE